MLRDWQSQARVPTCVLLRSWPHLGGLWLSPGILGHLEGFENPCACALSTGWARRHDVRVPPGSDVQPELRSTAEGEPGPARWLLLGMGDNFRFAIYTL